MKPTRPNEVKKFLRRPLRGRPWCSDATAGNRKRIVGDGASWRSRPTVSVVGLIGLGGFVALTIVVVVHPAPLPMDHAAPVVVVVKTHSGPRRRPRADLARHGLGPGPAARVGRAAARTTGPAMATGSGWAGAAVRWPAGPLRDVDHDRPAAPARHGPGDYGQRGELSIRARDHRRVRTRARRPSDRAGSALTRCPARRRRGRRSRRSHCRRDPVLPGVHWVSDVIAGWGLAAIMLVIAAGILKRVPAIFTSTAQIPTSRQCEPDAQQRSACEMSTIIGRCGGSHVKAADRELERAKNIEARRDQTGWHHRRPRTAPPPPHPEPTLSCACRDNEAVELALGGAAGTNIEDVA